jgi:opacity protein-like surface antigen
MNARQFRLLGVAALPLIACGWLPTAGAAEGPRYTYLDLGYSWSDVNYAVKQEGGEFEGLALDGSVGLVDAGPVGIHLFGEFFDGDFDGVQDPCSGQVGSRDSTSYALGAGASYPVQETVDLVGRVAYINVDLDIPNSTCQLQSVDSDGYFLEGLVRAAMSEQVELEAGYRYSDLTGSDISDSSVMLAMNYNVNSWFAARVAGIVFDDDSAIEFAVRVYFSDFLGRDNLF